MLAVTENGYGKRSPVEEYRITGRGGKGVITIKNTPRNGPLVAIKEVKPEDQLMIMTRNGVVDPAQDRRRLRSWAATPRVYAW